MTRAGAPRYSLEETVKRPVSVFSGAPSGPGGASFHGNTDNPGGILAGSIVGGSDDHIAATSRFTPTTRSLNQIMSLSLVVVFLCLPK